MDSPETLADDLMWGVADIATFIGRTSRQTWEALDKGDLPARQVNGRWCASRARLRAFFTGMDAGEGPSPSPIPASPSAPAPRPGRRSKPSKAGATVHKLMPRNGRAA